MSTPSAKDIAALFVDGTDVKQSNNEMSITSEALAPQRRPFGSASQRCFLTGQKDSEVSISGWLATETSTVLGDISTPLDAAHVVSVLFDGGLVSSRFYGLKAANIVGAKVGMSEDDLDTFEPGLRLDGCYAHLGYVAAPHVARTAAGNTDATYATMVETSAAAGVAFLHVSALALGGSTSCTVKVRHSTDHITFTDLATFTNLTAAGAEAVAIAATVNKYLSISWAWNGAGADQSITCFVGVAVD